MWCSSSAHSAAVLSHFTLQSWPSLLYLQNQPIAAAASSATCTLPNAGLDTRGQHLSSVHMLLHGPVLCPCGIRHSFCLCRVLPKYRQCFGGHVVTCHCGARMDIRVSAGNAWRLHRAFWCDFGRLCRCLSDYTDSIHSLVSGMDQRNLGCLQIHRALRHSGRWALFCLGVEVCSLGKELFLDITVTAWLWRRWERCSNSQRWNW